MYKTLIAGLVMILAACTNAPSPLNATKADALVRGQMFSREPVYAEVPQKVWFGPKAPKDDYDELAIRTLRNLESKGLVTVVHSTTADGTQTYQAKVTKKGFNILGTMPSHRGPVYRGQICEKIFDGTRNFIAHPSNPNVGRVEAVWHYDNPSFLYPMFETRINKPLKKPFTSMVSIYWEKGVWKFNVMVRKSEGS